MVNGMKLFSMKLKKTLDSIHPLSVAAYVVPGNALLFIGIQESHTDFPLNIKRGGPLILLALHEIKTDIFSPPDPWVVRVADTPTVPTVLVFERSKQKPVSKPIYSQQHFSRYLPVFN